MTDVVRTVERAERILEDHLYAATVGEGRAARFAREDVFPSVWLVSRGVQMALSILVQTALFV